MAERQPAVREYSVFRVAEPSAAPALAQAWRAARTARAAHRPRTRPRHRGPAPEHGAERG